MSTLMSKPPRAEEEGVKAEGFIFILVPLARAELARRKRRPWSGERNRMSKRYANSGLSCLRQEDFVQLATEHWNASLSWKTQCARRWPNSATNTRSRGSCAACSTTGEKSPGATTRGLM